MSQMFIQKELSISSKKALSPKYMPQSLDAFLVTSFVHGPFSNVRFFLVKQFTVKISNALNTSHYSISTLHLENRPVN